MAASLRGHLEIVKYLVDEGVDVNIQDKVSSDCLYVYMEHHETIL